MKFILFVCFLFGSVAYAQDPVIESSIGDRNTTVQYDAKKDKCYSLQFRGYSEYKKSISKKDLACQRLVQAYEQASQEPCQYREIENKKDQDGYGSHTWVTRLSPSCQCTSTYTYSSSYAGQFIYDVQTYILDPEECQ